METMTTPLGRFLKEQRNQRGWTQKVLAAESGVPQATISDVERGSNKLPGAGYRRALAQALGVRHIDLLIAAGEVTPEELPIEGAPRELFPKGSTKANIIDCIEPMNEADADEVLFYAKTRLTYRDQRLQAARDTAAPQAE